MTSETSNLSTDTTAQPSRALHYTLWCFQALLAFAFGMAGVMKTTAPIADLAHKMVWPGVVPAPLVRFIGTSELAAALGLVLPAATRIKPTLTPLAASGLVVVMILAAIFHISRGEVQALPINGTLGAMAALIAWGRFRKVPIQPRS